LACVCYFGVLGVCRAFFVWLSSCSRAATPAVLRWLRVLLLLLGPQRACPLSSGLVQWVPLRALPRPPAGPGYSFPAHRRSRSFVPDPAHDPRSRGGTPVSTPSLFLRLAPFLYFADRDAPSLFSPLLTVPVMTAWPRPRPRFLFGRFSGTPGMQRYQRIFTVGLVRLRCPACIPVASCLRTGLRRAPPWAAWPVPVAPSAVSTVAFTYAAGFTPLAFDGRMRCCLHSRIWVRPGLAVAIGQRLAGRWAAHSLLHSPVHFHRRPRFSGRLVFRR